jgi:hypothetical protein
MPEEIDPQHNATRALLRAVGPGVVLVGLVFTIIGLGSFFSSFGTFEPPRYFWCVFVGFPLLAVGGAICQYAFIGAVTRYVADEVAPVGKDVVNYMADGTQGAVRTIAAAVGEGLHAGASVQDAPAIRCRKCHADNEASAKFCKTCGTPLARSSLCPGCGKANDPDARFCDHCGTALA